MSFDTGMMSAVGSDRGYRANGNKRPPKKWQRFLVRSLTMLVGLGLLVFGAWTCASGADPGAGVALIGIGLLLGLVAVSDHFRTSKQKH